MRHGAPLGRELEALGHRVRLLPPSDVARYRDGNKTDRADAIALLEASRNEAIDAVPIKTIEQQALTSLHRLRSAYVADRTARINTARGILREFGHAIPQGARTFVAHARIALEDERLPLHLRDELGRALDEIVALRKTANEITQRIESLAEQMPDVAYLRTVPGIGVLTATAFVAFIGKPQRFRSGRHFASFLGLTPRESSSGLRRRSAASRRRATPTCACCSSTARARRCSLLTRAKQPDPLQLWAMRVQLRSGHNKATVALANRLARIAWRVWRDQRPYSPRIRPPGPWRCPLEPSCNEISRMAHGLTGVGTSR